MRSREGFAGDSWARGRGEEKQRATSHAVESGKGPQQTRDAIMKTRPSTETLKTGASAEYRFEHVQRRQSIACTTNFVGKALECPHSFTHCKRIQSL